MMEEQELLEEVVLCVSSMNLRYGSDGLHHGMWISQMIDDLDDKESDKSFTKAHLGALQHRIDELQLTLDKLKEVL